MSIIVNNLTKKYGQQVAVNGISFTANPGEITGFLGPNGAGKSTTMKMITGYLHKDDGGIKVCGVEVDPEGIDTKNNIGYLPESNPLYYDMYVKEYLHFIAGLHKIKNAKAAVDKVIEQVGLTPEAGKKTGQLSKGYKQRVGLAAAIIHEPKVLILDEPTNGLDPNQIVEIRNVIKSLAKDKTILLSSHIMQEVEALCDRIIIINKGNLVADDGGIKVCGVEVDPEGIDTKNNIGYLPESNPLYYDMYVKEYLHFIAGLHKIKNAKAAVDKVIEQVGLTPEAGKKTGQLSKGYKQRVGLAAAIIHEPKVLILDEPTNGLDPNQIVEIRNVIKSLAKDKTILLSSHIMQEVEALCDRIIIINKGNLVADDSLQHLKETGTGTEYITVVFQNEVELKTLQNLPGAGTVSQAGKEIKIITRDKEVFRKALMQYSMDNNNDIISMQQGSNSIEDVFRNLTETPIKD